LRALSLCACCRHYPGTATGGTTLLIRPVMSAFPGRVAGSACASSFSRLTQRSLALRPAHSRCHQFVARLPEGFRHFVTSMPAPVASGWSGCRVGFAPTGKRRLFTAHTQTGHPPARIGRRPAVIGACSRDCGIGAASRCTNSRSPDAWCRRATGSWASAARGLRRCARLSSRSLAWHRTSQSQHLLAGVWAGAPSAPRQSTPASRARAASRSGVEKPDVNCAIVGSMSGRTLEPRPLSCHRRAKPLAARSS